MCTCNRGPARAGPQASCPGCSVCDHVSLPSCVRPVATAQASQLIQCIDSVMTDLAPASARSRRRAAADHQRRAAALHAGWRSGPPASLCMLPRALHRVPAPPAARRARWVPRCAHSHRQGMSGHMSSQPGMVDQSGMPRPCGQSFTCILSPSHRLAWHVMLLLLVELIWP
jgi:hypothetical protein